MIRKNRLSSANFAKTPAIPSGHETNFTTDLLNDENNIGKMVTNIYSLSVSEDLVHFLRLANWEKELVGNFSAS